MILVDTNVLVDLFTNDPVWQPWSAAELERQAACGQLRINEVIYAELSARMDSMAKLNDTLSVLDVGLTRMPIEALFEAGKTFNRYRAAGGIRSAILPDFFVGSHAHVLQWPILTRDIRRYRSYFPGVVLIAPEN
jgi:predicted nucleic acid-binding protein